MLSTHPLRCDVVGAGVNGWRQPLFTLVIAPFSMMLQCFPVTNFKTGFEAVLHHDALWHCAFPSHLFPQRLLSLVAVCTRPCPFFEIPHPRLSHHTSPPWAGCRSGCSSAGTGGTSPQWPSPPSCTTRWRACSPTPATPPRCLPRSRMQAPCCGTVCHPQGGGAGCSLFNNDPHFIVWVPEVGH